MNSLADLDFGDRRVDVLPAAYRCDRFDVVHKSSLGSVSDLAIFEKRRWRDGCCPIFLVGIPYHGLFGYTAEGKRELYDSNRLLFVSAHQDYIEDHPVDGIGHASLLLEPTLDVLEEVCGTTPEHHDAFKLVTTPSSTTVRVLAQRLLKSPMVGKSLYVDEIMLLALKESLRAQPRANRRNSSLVNRAKEILHAMDGAPICLADIAREVRASAVYLTQEFTRSEGMPLYRYQTQLRLNRALLLLPECESITELALDLGFSSHSHFTSVFRSNFGVTPSRYRNENCLKSFAVS